MSIPEYIDMTLIIYWFFLKFIFFSFLIISINALKQYFEKYPNGLSTVDENMTFYTDLIPFI